jgi:hypothetical protein
MRFFDHLERDPSRSLFKIFSWSWPKALFWTLYFLYNPKRTLNPKPKLEAIRAVLMSIGHFNIKLSFIGDGCLRASENFSRNWIWESLVWKLMMSCYKGRLSYVPSLTQKEFINRTLLSTLKSFRLRYTVGLFCLWDVWFNKKTGKFC